MGIYCLAVKVLLLLAGRSRRFWPLQEKSLFPLCGKALLTHQVERLSQAGLSDITLVLGKHNQDAIRALSPKLPFVIQKDTEGGMMAACLEALPRLGAEPVLIVSGNDMIEPQAFTQLLAQSRKRGVGGAILTQAVTSYFPGGYVTLRGSRVTAIVEKPGAGREPSKFVNIVAHVHSDASKLLAALKKVHNRKDDGYEQALGTLLKEHRYDAVRYKGVWQPVKYPWHLLALLELLLKDIRKPAVHKTASVHKTAVVEGSVVIGEGTRVLPHATVVGPCYIGKNCIIGNGALVRGSSIGDSSVIGYNTEVKGSVLAGSVWTHMTYLGDSVVGENVSFGGGCITGNLRLDEGKIASACDGQSVPSGLVKFGTVVGGGCRFGIGVKTNPGVKVGRDCFVAGGCFLHEDIPDGSFAVTKEGKLELKKNRTRAPQMEEREKFLKFSRNPHP